MFADVQVGLGKARCCFVQLTELFRAGYSGAAWQASGGDGSIFISCARLQRRQVRPPAVSSRTLPGLYLPTIGRRNGAPRHIEN